jgi:hypothetical protein
MSVSEAAKQTLLTSIGALNASIVAGKSAVETTDKVITVVGNTTVNVDKIATAATDITVTSAEATGKIVDAIGNNTAKLTDEAANATVASVKSLTDQLTNTNEITTTLMNTANESLKQTTKPITIIIGDVFKSSATIIGSILYVLTVPFEGMATKIRKIKENNKSAKTIFNKIKQAYINDYNTISKELQNSFIGQIDNMIKNAENLLKLYKKLGCVKYVFKGYECPSEIQDKIDTIEKLYRFMEEDKDIFKSNLKSKFNMLLPYINSNQPYIHDKLTPEDMDKEITEFGEKIIIKQNEIVTDATKILSDALEKFNTGYIYIITNEIKKLKIPLIDTMNNSAKSAKSVKSVKSAKSVGGRNPRKSRQTKRNNK